MAFPNGKKAFGRILSGKNQYDIIKRERSANARAVLHSFTESL